MRQDQPPSVSFPERGKLAGKLLSDPAASEILTPKEEEAKLLLDRHSPPGVVINARNEVVHCPTRNNRWLELPTGEPTHDLLKLVREELRSDLRTAIVSKVYVETDDQEIDSVMAQAEPQASELT